MLALETLFGDLATLVGYDATLEEPMLEGPCTCYDTCAFALESLEWAPVVPGPASGTI